MKYRDLRTGDLLVGEFNSWLLLEHCGTKFKWLLCETQREPLVTFGEDTNDAVLDLFKLIRDRP